MSELKSLLNNQNGGGVPDPLQVSSIYTDTINPLTGATITINNAVLNPPPTPAPSTTLFNDTTAAETEFVGGKLAADTNRRIGVTNNGKISLGSGTATRDTYIYRPAASTVAIGTTAADSNGSLNAGTITASSLTNYAGNLTINPISATDFSNKDIVNVANVASNSFSSNSGTIGSTGLTMNGNIAMSVDKQITGSSTVGNPIVLLKNNGDTTDSLWLKPGQIVLGGGALAPDTTISRASAGVIDVTGIRTSTVTSTGDLALNPTGSNINMSSKNITNALDITGRYASLQRVDLLNIPGANTVFRTNVSGDAQWRSLMTADGTMRFGNGTDATAGTFAMLQCSATGGELVLSNDATQNGLGTLQCSTIRTPGTSNLVLNPRGTSIDCSGKTLINAVISGSSVAFPLNNVGSTATTSAITSQVTGDTYARYTLDTAGDMAWGPGGSSFQDIYLRRGTNPAEINISGFAPGGGEGNGKLVVDQIRGSSTNGLSITGGFGNPINFVNNNLTNIGSAQISTVSTASGDLTLNPVGSNINCSNKTLSNIGYPLDYSSSSTSANFLTSKLSADTQSRLAITNAGVLNFGSGSAASDVSLQRSAAGTISVSSTSGGTNLGNFVCGKLVADTIQANSTGYINIGSATISGGSNPTDTAVICSAATTYSAAANYTVSIANTAATFSGASRYSAIMCSTAGTISATSGCNMILSSGNGNTSITGTAGGTLLWGSYISTNNANVFGISDSSSTAVSVGTARTFYGRMSGGYYLATNAAASTGMQLSGGSSSWGAISDMRLKRIHDEVHVLDKVEKLRVVRYNYKSDEEDEEPRLGMIAQDVNTLYVELGVRRNYSLNHPESKEGDPIQTVSGDEIAYLSLAAIKEMKKMFMDFKKQSEFQIDMLSSRIRTLEDDNAELRKKLDDLVIGF